MLTNPFPQGKQLLAGMNASTRTHTGGNQDGESTLNVYMVKYHVDISIRAHDYGEEEPYKVKNVSDIREPLPIERLTVEPIPQMLKGSSKWSTYNPNVRASHKYSIIEDLA